MVCPLIMTSTNKMLLRVCDFSTNLLFSVTYAHAKINIVQIECSIKGSTNKTLVFHIHETTKIALITLLPGPSHDKRPLPDITPSFLFGT